MAMGNVSRGIPVMLNGSSSGDRLPDIRHGGVDDLTTELWRSCAGPLVNVPQVGDMVFYLPQAHLEQVEACMKQDGQMEMPVYNLPNKILCKVLGVDLKAEAGTDEVFAQIALIPVTKQDGFSSLEKANSLPSPCRTSARSFAKKLTSSDTNTHGGFSVLKRHAEECLPPMNMSLEPPEQKLIAKDLHGLEWCFRHVYRGNPKRHLLTTGWSTFVTSKKLVAGDTLIFLRGDNGELRIGVRRAAKLKNIASTTVISAICMRLGILAAAYHALSTGTMFIVYYRPWTSPTEFIIPFDKYMKSTQILYSVGSRFTMLFEGDDCQEQRIERCEGTIVAIEDVDHTRWPNSEWNSHKVEWDDTSNGIQRPERVSPWNIEPIEPVEKSHSSSQNPSKRARLADTSLSGFHSVAKDAQNHFEVFQGQERDTSVNKLGTLIIPPNPDCPVHGPIYPSPSGTIPFSGGNITAFGLPNNYNLFPSSHGIPENAIGGTNFPALNASSYCSGSPGQRTSGRKNENEVYVFGVNLVSNPPELPSPQVYSNHDSHDLKSPMSPSSVSQPSKSNSATNSVHQCKNSTNIHCIKVFKYGSAGRSVDLTRFDGYGELKSQLDQMFELNGSLVDGKDGWQVIYTDKVGDTMLIGDYPWQDFVCSVQRMFVCRKEDIGQLIPCSPIKLP